MYKCSENKNEKREWCWDFASANPECRFRGSEVIFHPTYSQGTCIVRGDKPLKLGYVHYWEIKIVSQLSGTDVMFGIGTDKVDLLSHQYRFASVLGSDNQSWGYSYHGLIQHNGELKHYGKKISRGCVVGVYVDLFRGNMEFYLNKKPLGIAFTNIPIQPGTRIYPMSCSTAAKSSIKLMNSTSCIESLQLNCMREIAQRQTFYPNIKQLPGLRPFVSNLWFLFHDDLFKYSHEAQSSDLSLDDEALIARKTGRLEGNEVSLWNDISDDEEESFHFYFMPYNPPDSYISCTNGFRQAFDYDE